MKKYLLILALLTSSLNPLFGQTVSQHRVYMPLIVGTGYSYEYSLSDKITISARLDYKLSMGSGDYDDHEFAYVGFDRMVMQARVSVEPRYYFGFEERSLLKKDYSNNAANYISIVGSYDIPGGLYMAPIPPEAFSIEPSYGWVRNIGSNVNYDISFYVGMKYKQLWDDFYPEVDMIGTVEEPDWGWVISAGFRLSIGYVF